MTMSQKQRQAIIELFKDGINARDVSIYMMQKYPDDKELWQYTFGDSMKHDDSYVKVLRTVFECSDSEILELRAEAKKQYETECYNGKNCGVS